jgi:MFS family permease
MVTSVGAYAVLRFIAGFGLAGELGAGMTLVSEILPARIRGYGATLVATLGVIGALLAYLVSSIFDWRTAYFIGGGLGLLLMILRVRVFESGIFLQLKQANVRRGDLLMLLSSIPRLAKYINGIVIGMPIWFVVGILITFSPEFGKALGLFHPVDAGKAVMFYFTGQLAGNLVSGFISQRLQSRRKAVLLFILCSASFVLVYLLVPLHTTTAFYTICTCLGFCCGYWTIFIAVAAELFGSNLRATVATTIPNFVRATVIPLSLLFGVTKKFAGTIYGALIVGLIVYVAAVIAILNLEETFKKDMNYNEGDEYS